MEQIHEKSMNNTTRCSTDKKLEFSSAKKHQLNQSNNSQKNSYNNSFIQGELNLQNLKANQRQKSPSNYEALMPSSSSKQVSWTSKNMIKIVKQRQQESAKKLQNSNSKLKPKKQNQREFTLNDVNSNEQVISKEQQETIDEQEKKYSTNFYRELVKQKVADKQHSNKHNRKPVILQMPKPSALATDMIRYNPFDIALDHKKAMAEEVDKEAAHQFSFGQKQEDSKQFLSGSESNSGIEVKECTWMDSLEETQFKAQAKEDSFENFSIGSDCNVSVISNGNATHKEIKPQKTYQSEYNFINNRSRDPSVKSIDSTINKAKFKINTLNLHQLWNKRSQQDQHTVVGEERYKSNAIHVFKIYGVYEGAEDQIFQIVNSREDKVELKSIKMAFEKKIVSHLTIKVICQSSKVINEVRHEIRRLGKSLQYNVINELQTV